MEKQHGEHNCQHHHSLRERWKTRSGICSLRRQGSAEASIGRNQRGKEFVCPLLTHRKPKPNPWPHAATTFTTRFTSNRVASTNRMHRVYRAVTGHTKISSKLGSGNSALLEELR